MNEHGVRTQIQFATQKGFKKKKGDRLTKQSDGGQGRSFQRGDKGRK